MNRNFSFSYIEKKYLNSLLKFVKTLVIKSDYDANKYEDLSKLDQIFRFILISENKDTIYNYEITVEKLIEWKKKLLIPAHLVDKFMEDPKVFYTYLESNIGENDKLSILKLCRNEFLDNYVESNRYYKELNGEPPSEEYYIKIYFTLDFKEIFCEGLHGSYPKWILERQYIDPSKISDISESMYQFYYSFEYLHNINELNYIELYKRIISDNLKLLKDIYDYYQYDYIMRIYDKIPYSKSRTAENFSILYYEDGILNDDDVKLFFKNYYKVLNYIKTVPYSKAKSSMELYDKFFIIVILLLTLMYMLSEKFNNIITRNFTSDIDKKLFLADYNMDDLVDLLPAKYIKKLIYHIDTLCSEMGSEKVIVDILKLFNITDITVYKYAILRTCKTDPITKDPIIDTSKPIEENYDIRMVKIPINDEYKSKSENSYLSNKLNHMDLKTVAMNDPYWGLNNKLKGRYDIINYDKEKYIEDMENILKRKNDISYIYTKYIGTLINIDIMKNIINSTYLLTSIMNCESVIDLKVRYNANLQPIRIRDIFAAISYIFIKRYPELEDKIVTDPNQISCYMGFNTNPSIEELYDIDSYYVHYEGGLKTIKLKSTLTEEDLQSNFIIINNMKTVPGVEPDTITSNFRKLYTINMNKYNALLSKLSNPNISYDSYIKYYNIFKYNMYTKSMIDIYLGYQTFESYLSIETPELYSYINQTLDISDKYDDDGNLSERYKTLCSNTLMIFVDILADLFAKDQEIKDSLTTVFKDNSSLFSNIFHILNKFKSYTVDLSEYNNTYIMDIKNSTILRAMDYMFDYENSFDEFDTIEVNYYEKLENIDSIVSNNDSIKLKDELLDNNKDDIVRFYNTVVDHILDSETDMEFSQNQYIMVDDELVLLDDINNIIETVKFKDEITEKK